MHLHFPLCHNFQLPSAGAKLRDYEGLTLSESDRSEPMRESPIRCETIAAITLY